MRSTPDSPLILATCQGGSSCLGKARCSEVCGVGGGIGPIGGDPAPFNLDARIQSVNSKIHKLIAKLWHEMLRILMFHCQTARLEPLLGHPG